MNQNLQTALSWLAMNVSPIPVVAHSKIPAVDWQMWQDRVPPKKVVDYWFSDSNLNVGVICGGKSNLAIIDFDDMDNYFVWRKDMLKRDDIYRTLALKSYKVKSSRGMHVYTRTSTREQSRKYPETRIDVRCHANYTLVPPSIHPSGAAYEAIGNPDMIVPVPSLEPIFPNPIKLPSRINDTLPVRERDIFDIGSSVHTIAEIKDTLPILKFVGQFTQVYRTSSSGRWWMARCINPTHKDRHPSFRIDTLYGRAKCLSSGCILYHDIGYDVVDLYMLMHGLDKAQAVKELMELYL